MLQRSLIISACVTASVFFSEVPASGQARPVDSFKPSGADTIDDFQSVCFGNIGAAGPTEAYWAGACRFQRFEDGDWRVITSASSDGPIRRQWGPGEIEATVELVDIGALPPSLFLDLADWGVIFLSPRDLDVQLEIARRVADRTPSSPDLGIVQRDYRVEMSVSDFESDNFGGGPAVNLVEIYCHIVEETPKASVSPLRSRKSAAKEEPGPAVLRYLNLTPFLRGAEDSGR